MTYRYRHADLHQEDDLVPRWKFVVALFGLVVISGVIIVWAVDMTRSRAAALRPSGYFPEKWLGPRHPVGRVREDLFEEHRRGRTTEAHDREVLATYGWVDEQRGVVRMPIERAMDLFVEGRRP